MLEKAFTERWRDGQLMRQEDPQLDGCFVIFERRRLQRFDAGLGSGRPRLTR
jgi:hypothetical protein